MSQNKSCFSLEHIAGLVSPEKRCLNLHQKKYKNQPIMSVVLKKKKA